MFPKIEHIDDVRLYVEAQPDEAFYIADKGDYLVVNYRSIMSIFPDLSVGHEAAILRECRGMIFCAKTGKILRRPLHKFFNFGERMESRDIDLNEIVAVYDKLDGSMVAPFFLNGDLVWGTKMGLTHMTDDLRSFVQRSTMESTLTSGKMMKKYHDFAGILISQRNMTPIFEYMAPKHRIVVNHPEETMSLLAVRDINTGEYMSYDKMASLASCFNIPVVKRWEVSDNASLVDQVRELEGTEGVVVELRNGDRLKVKSLWYMDLHKNREAIAKEKYVVGLILNERIDDALGLVPDHVRPKLEAYAKQFVMQYEERLEGIALSLYEALRTFETKKDFAISTIDSDHITRTIGFKLFDRRNDYPFHPHLMIADSFKEIILKMCDKSDTDFDKLCRKGIFNDSLPVWNIWDGTASDNS